MSKKPVATCAFILDFVSDFCNMQEMREKVVLKNVFILKYFPVK